MTRSVTGMQTLKMLQVCASRLCMCISFFVLKTVREGRAFVRSMPKKQLKRVNHKLSWRATDVPTTRRFRKTISGSEKSLFSTGLVDWKRKASCLDSRKLLVRSYTIRRPNTTVPKRDCSACCWQDRRSIDGGGRDCNPRVDRAVFPFFFFQQSSNNFWFAFSILKVARPAFTWQISINSAKINHLLRCSLRGELSCGPLTEVLQRFKWLITEQRGCACSRIGAEKFTQTSDPTRYDLRPQVKTSKYNLEAGVGGCCAIFSLPFPVRCLGKRFLACAFLGYPFFEKRICCILIKCVYLPLHL